MQEDHKELRQELPPQRKSSLRIAWYQPFLLVVER